MCISIFNKLSLQYLCLIILLICRFIADVYNVPFSIIKNNDVRIADIIEFFSFYFTLFYAFCILFRFHRISEVESGKLALLTIFSYSFIHFFEYFFYMGGRTSTYPPSEHFFLNFISFFILTGDAGFWQIVRIFSTGLLIVVLLFRKGKNFWPIGLSLFSFYTWSMLSVHTDIWIFLPVTKHEITLELTKSGVLTNISSSYGLLFLTIISYYDLSERSSEYFNRLLAQLWAPIIWSATFFICVLFSPSLLPAISISKLFLLTMCIAILTFSTTSVLFAMQSWKIILRSESYNNSNLLGVHPQIIAWVISILLIILTINSGIWMVLGYMLIYGIQERLLAKSNLNRDLIMFLASLFFSIYFLVLLAFTMDK